MIEEDAVVAGEQNSNSNFSSRFTDVVLKQPSNDLKSMLFLLMDCCGYEYRRLIQNRDILRKYLLKLYCEKKLSKELIIEVFGTMKKYKVLKELGLCKHWYFQNVDKLNHIKPVWKHLYAVCEELDDSEVDELRKLLAPQITNVSCAEELICRLFLCEKVSPDNFSHLADALGHIGRSELSTFCSSTATALNTGVYQYKIRDPTVTNPCGLAVIINQETFTQKQLQSGKIVHFRDRRGSSIDAAKLEELWTLFGLETEVYNNLTADNMRKNFCEISQRTEVDYDVFVACLLSHGEKDVIFGSDCEAVKIDELETIMANMCPHLRGKPKVFVIQACQGSERHEGSEILPVVSPNAEEIQTDAVGHMPVPSTRCPVPDYADIYKAIATVPGYVSYRDPDKGSLFISALTEMLREHGHHEDIDQILKRVKSRLASGNQNLVQMPICSSTLRGNLIFKRVDQ